MPGIVLRQTAVDKLIGDPKIRQWRKHEFGKVPFLRYYRRSYFTAHDGTITEYGDGFMLTTIDPHDRDETRDVVIKPAVVDDDFDILVGGEAIMSRSFAIGWTGKFTYEPEVK